MVFRFCVAFSVFQTVGAAKEPMNVNVFAQYSDGTEENAKCEGDVVKFVYYKWYLGDCHTLDDNDADPHESEKALCLNGERHLQLFSDKSCTSPMGDPFVNENDVNGFCVGGTGKRAGCGNFQCEEIDGSLQCDHTPDKSVYEVTTTTHPPRALDVVVVNWFESSTKCTGDSSQGFGEFPKELADAECDGEGKLKRWCQDGEVMVQEYSDSECRTEKGEAKVSDECIKITDTASYNFVACGNYMCSGPWTSLECDYKNKSSGTEMPNRMFAVLMLVVAGVLTA